MRVAIVGGTGFVGRHVVESLQARGHTVLLLARREHATPKGAAFVRCDLACGPLPTGILRGCDAVVNLAGIKREAGTQTFEAVHVGVTRRLIAGCREDGVRRFVQISVVCSRPDAANPYHDTKWRAEEAVAGSGLDYTILRPGVIYGPGDDMVTHLVRMIRFSPVFPIVGRGESLLQPVDVRDVAGAVAATLERPQSIGARYDIVGPEHLSLRAVVQTVAAGVGLRLLILPTPLAIQRIAVRAMNALMPEPLSTPSQLQMLAEGLFGEGEPAQQALGLVPRRFTADSVRQLEGTIGSLFGLSLRLVDGRSPAAWLSRRGSAFGPALALAALAVVLPMVLGPLVPNVWYRLGLSVVAFRSSP